MNTAIVHSRLAASLRRRVKQFYDRLNRREFEKCYETLDPQLLALPTCITLLQYMASLERFLAWCGAVELGAIELLQLHTKERSRLYNDRDFALVRVSWQDSAGGHHTFKERWVRDRRGWWFTRSTGFVVPN
jgi:hypothetical protein